MKKNFLAPILENKAVTAITKYCRDHRSTILAGGTIGFSLTTTAVVFRNSPMIHDIIWDTRDALEAANSDEEKKSIYKAAIQELVPLVVPIIFFQTGTIVTTIMTKKDSDKKDKRIAELTSAVAVASQAIEQYQLFQKEAEEQLGEKKYKKIMDGAYKDQEVDGRRFTALASEGAPGEVLFIDKYSGRPFWSDTHKLEYATKELDRRLTSGEEDQVCINDWYDIIGNTDLTPNELGERFGFIAPEYMGDIRAQFSDTHYVFPNGTKIPAFEVYMFPEPDYLP
jgi:hypothetical protein